MGASWWRQGVIYQIYPRSFQDANGDGVGDLAGIERRLDYLSGLGVDAIWLSPIFRSPMADFGYDVADYCAIDPLFGTLGDFDRLLAATHARGIRLILDFVPNHSSSQHSWFTESRSSRSSAKRDWYIWRDPAPGGGPPNNWISDFGGPAWEYDPATTQYYYHAFLKEQPDLNWRNPQVRKAMLDVLRFWLDRGVDGFRIDVLWHLIKAEGFPDNPTNPDYRTGMGEMHSVLQLHSTDQPEVHDIAADMRRLADDYGDRLLIGEVYLPLERLMTYYGDGAGVHMPFNFQLIDAPWNARTLAHLIADYEAALPSGAWPNWVLGNHDRPRIAARVGKAQARVAAMLLLTLRGTPTLYYGDELGIGSVDIPPERVRDPREFREPGLGLGRDPVRTPMPWQGDVPHAGFSDVEPWLPLNSDWHVRNVETQNGDPDSMLGLHRRLLALRREHRALADGTISLLDSPEDLLAYERRAVDEHLLVLLNLSGEPQNFDLPEGASQSEMLVSTLAHRPVTASRSLTLAPDEGVVVRVFA